ncbi:YfiR family protein [Accumulibacter sp.]|uniref:YfiR family protein n=1 Tax=Accumulibacter sp. TaxID=2053492 RepID=UPI002621F145|nr:YfiR family protein [Accumulibacter sp.]
MRKLPPDARSTVTGRCRTPLLAVALALVAGWPGQACAQSAPAEENTLKAAFVYNFAKYTDWPDELWSRSPTLRVCTVGERGGFAQAVAALANKPAVRGKEVEVRQLARPEEASGCHFLVVAGRARMAEWTRAVRLAPVLTVGDAEGFATSGGIIGLYAEGDRLRFEINQEAAQRAGLKLSSQLLKLARLVKDESSASQR